MQIVKPYRIFALGLNFAVGISLIE